MRAAEIVWETPPPWGPNANGRRGESAPQRRRREFVEALQARPGEWAKWPERMTTGWPWSLCRDHPGLQAVRRRVGVDDDGTLRADFYLRWVQPQ